MNPHKRKITIGIPTFNEEDNIMMFFESLKKQKMGTNVIDKILFIDDSDDNTPHLIDRLKRENPDLGIELHHNNKRMGAANAWNTIFRKSGGSEVIVLLDADIELDKNCVSNLSDRVNGTTGLCASNTMPIIQKNNKYSKAAALIAFWLRSLRLNRLSKYTTMGRALALYSQDVTDIEIPIDTIAIDLYIQCKILEKHKDVVYNDNAIVYFKTPLNRSDFLSQVTRAMIGHRQISKYAKKFLLDVPFGILLKEFLKNSIQHPSYALALIYCYAILPYSYFKNKEKVSYLWDMATSTKQ
jgi:glycosyltransferase involved in cell wall biosynthesis